MPKAMTIATLNMKGGVGKTTLAVNLAWHWVRVDKKKVLLVDLDPQFNASQWLMEPDKFVEHCQKHGTVADLLIEPRRQRMALKGARRTPRTNVDDCIYEVEENFDLLPSELGLSRAVKNPEGVPYKLEKALQSVVSRYDYIVIDCAPTDSVLTPTALTASDYILVPMRPDQFSVLGYAQILEALDDFRNDYPDPHGVRDLGVVFTQVIDNSHVQDRCISDVTKQASYVFGTQLRYSRTYARAIQEQTPVFDTKHAREITRDEISELVNELHDRIEALEEEEPGK